MSEDSDLLIIKFSPTYEHTKIYNKILASSAELKTTLLNYELIPMRVRAALEHVEILANSNATNLTLEQICLINGLLGEKGHIRKPSKGWHDENNIGINGYEPPASERHNLEEIFTEFLTYTLIDKNSNPIEAACKAYFTFEQIHPFNNGNGRTGRAICSWILLKHGYGLLASCIENRWGQENAKHREAFKSPVNNYFAWLGNPEFLNCFYSTFYTYFLNEMLDIVNNDLKIITNKAASDSEC